MLGEPSAFEYPPEMEIVVTLQYSYGMNHQHRHDTYSIVTSLFATLSKRVTSTGR